MLDPAAGRGCSGGKELKLFLHLGRINGVTGGDMNQNGLVMVPFSTDFISNIYIEIN